MHEGQLSTLLGVPGIPEAAELIALQRDLILVEETGVDAHFCRLSCGKSVQLVAAAKRRGLSVTADAAAANLLFSENDIKGFDSQFRVTPPIRSKKDLSLLRNGIKSGKLDAITSNHEPHDTDAKLAPFSQAEPGISFFDTFLSSLMELVNNKRLSMDALVASVSVNPSKILGIDGGSLSKGARADVCVFDPQKAWQVTSEEMLSYGKNTPLLGHRYNGKVAMTLVNGRVVFNQLD